MNADELIENFSYLLDWEDKYRYLIELGEKMESLPKKERTEDLKVDGCQSQVWIKGEKKEDKFYFQAASDAIIVQGLEAVLLSFVNGKTAQEIQNLDLLGLFKNLGLEENISPTRRNGFASMVQRIYDLTKTPNL